MTVLERLDHVRQRMRDLSRALEPPNRIFDADEVNRKVKNRLEQMEFEARLGKDVPAPGN
jgi:hypothetical protein